MVETAGKPVVAGQVFIVIRLLGDLQPVTLVPRGRVTHLKRF